MVDSGDDNTLKIASTFNIKVVKSHKGRAIQMNKGAFEAKGDVLFFLHIDTDVPFHFLRQIEKEITNGTKAGCFRMQFDDLHWLMRFYGWCTRFSFQFCRGGDQTLFIKKDFFEEIGGFNESLKVMEDIEVIARIKRKTKFKLLNDKVITSARKYKTNGRVRLQLIFGCIHIMSSLGFSQEKIIQFYSSNVR